LKVPNQESTRSKITTVDTQTTPNHQKTQTRLIWYTKESLIQATKESNKSFIEPKLSEHLLANPSIINIMQQTCIWLACKKVFVINDVVFKLDTEPWVKIHSSPMMKGKWFFETGGGLTCLFHNNSG
jgi:hypothetical protein